MSPEPVPAATKTILVVDDEETIIDFYQMALMREGFQVVAVEDGKAALSYLKGNANRKVDLIITDLMMPGMGGYDILKEMQQEDYRRIPIFVSTAKSLTPDTLEMIRMESNVHEFLPKPIDPDELARKVHAALGTRRGK